MIIIPENDLASLYSYFIIPEKFGEKRTQNTGLSVPSTAHTFDEYCFNLCVDLNIFVYLDVQIEPF